MNHKWREKILGHLQFARHWLKEAEADFSRNDNLRGELNLALVEAEVRHAWELSAGKVQAEKIQPKPRQVWFWSPVAGILITLLFIGQLAPADMPQEEVPAATSAAEQQAAQVQPEPVQVSSRKTSPPQETAVGDVPAVPQQQETPAVEKQSLEAKLEGGQAIQKQKSRPEEEKTVEPPKPAPEPAEAAAEPSIEYDLRELTRLAQEVLYAKADS